MPDPQDTQDRFASPLGLVLDHVHRGLGVQEALFLSFTADLGFFEQIALGVTQATGAAITVVGDASMAVTDPRATRRAGRSYLAGLAQLPGRAFHPKLVVLAGVEHATLAIGSGNTTLADWQHNHELWTVLRATTNHSPALVADLADWLLELPERIRLAPGVPQALHRTAHLLHQLHANAPEHEDTWQLVSSLHLPILDQLPHGPVDELALYAPFYDPASRAVDRLLERLQPARLTIGYQPQLTVLDGASLATAADRWGGRVVAHDTGRYRHGKLIEWTTAGRRFALTGSANLTAAALLRSVSEGGNCELGVIAPIPATLFPPGTPTPLAHLRTLPAPTYTPTPAGPLLLGAALTSTGLDIILASPLDRPGYLQLSPATAPPEHWERLGEIPAGSNHLHLTVLCEPGSRIRAALPTDDTPTLFSNTVFLADLERVLRRPGAAAAPTPTARPVDLFEDHRLAERFLADLEALRAEHHTADRTIPAPTAVTSDTSLHAYLDRCTARYGPRLTHFAFGLPQPQDTDPDVTPDLLPVAWDEDMDDTEAETLEPTEDDDPDEAGRTADDRLPDIRAAGEKARRRYRAWAGHLTAAVPRLPIPERLLALRLLLWIVAAGAWPREDTGWTSQVADCLAALAADDLPTPLEPHVGSLAAVATAVLRAHAPRTAITDESVAFTTATKKAGHLLSAADPAYIAEYTRLLAPAFGTTVDPQAVLDIAEEIVQDDPIQDAVAAMAERGRLVRRTGPYLLEVDDSRGNPVFQALEAVGSAETATLVAASAHARDHTAFVLWQRPQLIIIETRGSNRWWRLFRLNGPFQSPRALARSKQLPSPSGRGTGPLPGSLEEAVAKACNRA